METKRRARRRDSAQRQRKRTGLGSLLDLAVDPPLLLRLRSMTSLRQGPRPWHREDGGSARSNGGESLKDEPWPAGPTNAVAGRFGAPFPVGLKACAGRGGGGGLLAT